MGEFAAVPTLQLSETQGSVESVGGGAREKERERRPDFCSPHLISVYSSLNPLISVQFLLIYTGVQESRIGPIVRGRANLELESQCEPSPCE